MTQNQPEKIIVIDVALVHHLIASQFPQWQHLPIKAVKQSGWDNRTFHLGDELTIRMPSSAEYAGQAEKEQKWLPILAPQLPLPIPSPIAIGEPDERYPWRWCINHWLIGEPAATAPIADLDQFALTLGTFLKALQRINPKGGPAAGPQSFYRGGDLSVYDPETQQALTLLKDKIDTQAASQIWEAALATTWKNVPVWVHGDVSAGNLLVHEGKLCAVIDFGQLAVGDPACDLAIAWTFFQGTSRELFHKTLQLDSETWARARAWTLWKAMMYLVNNQTDMNYEARKALQIINEVITDQCSY